MARNTSTPFTPCERRCVVSNQYFGDDRIVHESIDVSKASSHRIYSNSEAPDDIVTRLRARALIAFQNGADGNAFIDEKAADEIERLRVIIRGISDAVTNEGINPQYHRKVVAKTKTDWPFFWSKIEVLLKEVHGE